MKNPSTVRAALGLGLALAIASQAAAAQPKPEIPRMGLWELTTVSGGKTDVDKICITEEDLSEWNMFKRFEPECKEECKIGGGKIDCTSKCKHGKTQIEGKVKGTYGSTAYAMTMQATSAGKAGNTATISGRYLAPQCGNIK